VKVTVAPGTTAPLESVTVPRISVDVVWAAINAAKNTTQRKYFTKLENLIRYLQKHRL
jgi:hypothetical protein